MTEQTPQIPSIKPDKRNYGIDLLRMLAMYMVLILHILGQGGVIASSASKSTTHYNIAWLMEIAAYGAVNLYALISGFVGYNSKSKMSKIMSLRLQTSFWAVLFVIIFTFFPPVNVVEPVTASNWFGAFFPMITKQYWYVTAYFGLLFLKPFLDGGIKSISEKQFYIFISAVFVFFLVLPMFKETVDIS